MVLENFDQLITKVRSFDRRRRVAVVCAHDEHALEAVFHAQDNHIVEPILIGDVPKIKEMMARLNRRLNGEAIIDTTDDKTAAYKAVQLVNEGRAEFIMKGKIQTADLLKAVVDKEKGLGTGQVMSLFDMKQVPVYHKLLVLTDSGMMLYPDLQQKKQILENAVKTLRKLGYENPKVAVLSAVETVNPKMQDTLDGAELKRMNQQGEITGCIVEGPISYDLAMSRESAELKGFNSPVVGDPDVLLVPNMTAGNILGKSLNYSAHAKMAGTIIGAKVPIVLTSRGSSAEEKYYSLVLSAAVS